MIALVVGALWLFVAVRVALTIGRAIRAADQAEHERQP